MGTTQSAIDTLPEVLDYTQPKDYEVGGIRVTGAEFSDENAIISIAGFKIGDKVRIPGGDIPRAIKNLWKLRLFTDVQIYKERSLGDIVFLEIVVQERPRLSRHSYQGVKKTFHDDLNEEVNKYLSLQNSQDKLNKWWRLLIGYGAHRRHHQPSGFQGEAGRNEDLHQVSDQGRPNSLGARALNQRTFSLQ